MHPVILGDLAQDRIRSFVAEADADRLRRLAAAGRPSPGLRHRTGVRLIALGNRLTCEGARLAGGRV